MRLAITVRLIIALYIFADFVADIVKALLDRAASDRSLSVGLGVWITNDFSRNTNEINTAISFIKQYYRKATITHLNIGTETLYRGEISIS